MNFLLSSHKVGRILGIDVHIAYSLYLITGLFIMQYSQSGIYAVLSMLLIPVCVLAHELGHSVVSQKFGVRVNRIVLHMLGGAAEIGGLIPGPKAEILIAIMGPIVSLFIAGISLIMMIVLQNSPAIELFYYLTYMNTFLAIFNLIPVFPMDGGRIALATIMIFKGPEKALRFVKPMTIAGVALLCGYGALNMLSGNPNGLFMILIGVLVYFQGNQELQARMYAARYSSMHDTWQNSFKSDKHKDATYNSSNYNKSKKSSKDTFKEDSIIGAWRKKRKASKEAKLKAKRTELDDRVDEVLRKVKEEGISTLSPGEKALLQSASKKYKKNFK